MLVLLVTIFLLEQVGCFPGFELLNPTMVGLGPLYLVLFDPVLTIPLSPTIFRKLD